MGELTCLLEWPAGLSPLLERQVDLSPSLEWPADLYLQSKFTDLLLSFQVSCGNMNILFASCIFCWSELTYEGHAISFQTFFVWVFRIVVDSWKYTTLLLYILWDVWPIFMISHSNEQLQQHMEYTLLKPDCHCWWISKMQSDTIEKRYAIELCFKLRKKCHRNVWNASDCFWTILRESSVSFWVA